MGAGQAFLKPFNKSWQYTLRHASAHVDIFWCSPTRLEGPEDVQDGAIRAVRSDLASVRPRKSNDYVLDPAAVVEVLLTQTLVSWYELVPQLQVT